MSFELVRVSQIEEENKNVAFEPEPIPPPHPQKPDLGTRKVKITIMTQHVAREKHHTL